MKIRKIANQFEDEGFDSEKQIEEVENFETQQNYKDSTVGKRGTTQTSKVLMSLRDNLGEPIQASWVANGSVGWFQVDDIIYEVSVAPAAYGYYFEYFKELNERATRPDTEEQPENQVEDQIEDQVEDDLPM